MRSCSQILGVARSLHVFLWPLLFAKLWNLPNPLPLGGAYMQADLAAIVPTIIQPIRFADSAAFVTADRAAIASNDCRHSSVFLYLFYTRKWLRMGGK